MCLFRARFKKMLNLEQRNTKRRVEIEKKIGAARSYCMDQSYFRFLFQLARKSKQSGLSKSEKRLAKRNATKVKISQELTVTKTFPFSVGPVGKDLHSS